MGATNLRVIACGTFLIGLALTVSSSIGQTINSFFLEHNGYHYNETNLMGQRLTANGGLADFYFLGTPPDHLFQNWWWYRSSSDTREYALSNQTFGQQTSTNTAILTYVEPIADGAQPGALQWNFNYMLIGGIPAFAQMQWSVENLTPTPQHVDFFAYTDFDLNQTPVDDTAQSEGPAFIHQSDPDGFTEVQVSASNTNFANWELAPFSTILDKLVDPVPTNLLNVAPQIGPTNVTLGFQWSFDLGPFGSEIDTASGSLTKRLKAVPEPTLLMMAVAFGLYGSLRRKSRSVLAGM